MREFKKGELVKVTKKQKICIDENLREFSYVGHRYVEVEEVGEIFGVINCRGTCKKRDVKKCVSQSLIIEGWGDRAICSGYFRHLTKQEEFLYHIYGDSYGDDNADTI